MARICAFQMPVNGDLLIYIYIQEIELAKKKKNRLYDFIVLCTYDSPSNWSKSS